MQIEREPIQFWRNQDFKASFTNQCCTQDSCKINGKFIGIRQNKCKFFLLARQFSIPMRKKENWKRKDTIEYNRMSEIISSITSDMLIAHSSSTSSVSEAGIMTEEEVVEKIKTYINQLIKEQED